jgi:hypothetical protein
VRVLAGLHLVVLEQVDDLRVVRRGDHRVEHPLDVLLHRDRLVDVLHELVVERAHATPFHRPRPESLSCR